jgi:AraC-like DNA-binding protein
MTPARRDDGPAPPRVYEERLPTSLLGPVVCTWVGRGRPAGVPHVVVPDACIDLIWDGDRVAVAGPHTGPVTIASSPRTAVGLRFRPGGAPGALRVPAHVLVDRSVDLVDVVGGAAVELVDALHDAPDPWIAARHLERAVAGWCRDAAAPDPIVDGVAASVRASHGAEHGRSTVADLADELGVGERQLHRRACAAVGYGPKVLERILRFRRFLALHDRHPERGLARLALEAGYADQSHLSRECRAIAGVPPSRLSGPVVSVGL